MLNELVGVAVRASLAFARVSGGWARHPGHASVYALRGLLGRIRALGLSQHADEHRPKRPVLLAVDQQLGGGAALR